LAVLAVSAPSSFLSSDVFYILLLSLEKRKNILI